MAWIGASGPGGFVVRSEGFAVRATREGVFLEKPRSPASLLLALLLVLPVLGVAAASLVPRWFALVLGALLALGLARWAGPWRRWHGAEHKVVEALLKVEEGLSPEEAWARARHLSPWCGTVLLGFLLPAALLLWLVWPPLAYFSPALALFLHLRLPEDSPLRAPGLLAERLFVAPPGPLEEVRAREAFELALRRTASGKAS